MLLSTWVSPLERMLEIMLIQFFQCSANTLAWLVHQRGYFGMAQIDRPALLLEALPNNIGVTSMVCLLPSHYSKGNILLGVFGHLEIAAIISVWLVL